MLKDYVFDKIIEFFEFKPTNSQINAVKQIASFQTINAEKDVLLLTGYAGTGKTSLMSAYVRYLNELQSNVVLLAPTGRAAKVLSSHVNMPAYTIHKVIYRQSGESAFSNFDLNFNKNRDTIFIVDEASMISNNNDGAAFFGSGQLLNDLVNFVFSSSGCKLVILGDTAQLPPIGIDISQALEKDYLEMLGLNVTSSELTDVVRQDEDSYILKNATYLREILANNDVIDFYPKLMFDNDMVKNISGAELMEELHYCYDNYGLEETLVVCRTNKRANMYNKGIRNSVLFREDEITSGDYLLVMKNNYHWINDDSKISFIANGDIARVLRIKKHYDLYGYRFADLTCELVDYNNVDIEARIILDSIYSDTAALSMKEQEEYYKKIEEDYVHIKSNRKRYEEIKNDDFYNALQVKFAYAMTCHKAQGGEWKAVFVDLGYFTEEYLNRGFVRWLYTAVTRATERLYFVNFPKDFIDKKDV